MQEIEVEDINFLLYTKTNIDKLILCYASCSKPLNN